MLLLLLANHSLIKKRCEEFMEVRVDNKYFSPLKQHSIISHLSYQCYKFMEVRIDNKYFSPLKQHSIISHLSYQCYKNISMKTDLLSLRFVPVNIGCKKKVSQFKYM